MLNPFHCWAVYTSLQAQQSSNRSPLHLWAMADTANCVQTKSKASLAVLARVAVLAVLSVSTSAVHHASIVFTLLGTAALSIAVQWCNTTLPEPNECRASCRLTGFAQPSLRDTRSASQATRLCFTPSLPFTPCHTDSLASHALQKHVACPGVLGVVVLRHHDTLILIYNKRHLKNAHRAAWLAAEAACRVLIRNILPTNTAVNRANHCLGSSRHHLNSAHRNHTTTNATLNRAKQPETLYNIKRHSPQASPQPCVTPCRPQTLLQPEQQA